MEIDKGLHIFLVLLENFHTSIQDTSYIYFFNNQISMNLTVEKKCFQVAEYQCIGEIVYGGIIHVEFNQLGEESIKFKFLHRESMTSP